MRTHSAIFRAQVGLFVGLFAFTSVATTVAVSAVQQNEQTRESILLSPVDKRYQINSGDEKKDVFKVVNDGDVAFDFIVYARPYSIENEQYTPDFTNDAKNADAYQWVQFDRTAYSLAPGKSVDIPYTVRVPQNATPGGHYGVIFAETQPSSQPEESASVQRKKRVGMILYTTVNGDVTTSGSIESTSVPFFQFNPPLKVGQRIANSGNTDFQVNTKVIVSDVFGVQKYTNERKMSVLPGTTRDIRSDWDGATWVGFYKVDLASSFLNDTNYTSTNYVLIVPLWVYILLALLIVGRLAYAATRRKRS